MNMKKNYYKPIEFESKIEKFWKQNKFFKTFNLGQKKFKIVLPPPNVTGNLHLGHAWDAYYPDLLIRYKQMNGFESIWYPGLDHAGIATQAKVEKLIFDETGKNRFELGREEFLSRVWEWKDTYSKNIFDQWSKMGLSLDYDKLKFTLDEDVNKLVNDVFIEFFEKGYMYKDTRLINWDPKLETAISNIEIISTKKKVKLYTIKYFIKNSKEFLEIATTRPETIFGDKAIFVNPDDERYKDLKNKVVVNPLSGEELPIIFDSYVDVEFGTGVMKATPAHDFNDYELAKKYNLKFVNIYNKNGTLNEKNGVFSSLDRFEAREEIIKYLEKNNMLISIEDYETTIPISERSNSIVEPMISSQWFLDSKKLANEALEFLKSKKSIEFFPLRFENDFKRWMENMEPWCVSRQLWWGHRIPAWYNPKGEMKVQVTSPGKDWKQDDDVLDTWFSSSLWPIVFSNKYDEEDYEVLSDILFTGYDIILFWVSRMIFQSIHLKDKIPFNKAIIHGLIRDENGKKMSKSLGNGINPIEVIDKWGSDSLRFFLLSNSTPGNDIRYSEVKVNESWNFMNKIFNINEFIKRISEQTKIIRDENIFKSKKLNSFDKYILNRVIEIYKLINDNLEKYNLAIIFTELKSFILNDFSSFYLEVIKKYKSDEAINNIINIFLEILIMLHPFIPFITEKIYLEWKEKLSPLHNSILEERFKKLDKSNKFSNKEVREVVDLRFLINTIRKVQSSSDYKNELIKLFVSKEIIFNDVDYYNVILKEFNSELILIDESDEDVKFSGAEIERGFGIIYYLYNSEKFKSIDLIKKDAIKEFNFELQRANKFLQNKKFMENAKVELIENEKNKRELYTDLLEMIS